MLSDRFVALLMFASLTLLVACSDDDHATAPVGDDPLPTVLPADPDGMLLSGSPADPAAAAIVSLAPSPAPAGTIAGNLLTTRLAAEIAPGATVGEVNAALEDQGAAIVSMTAGTPAVTLVIEAVADRDGAEALAASLVATGAFAYARPGLAVAQGVTSKLAAAKDLPHAEAAGRLAHTLPGRFPAAWNLRAAATDRAALVHPDWYADVPGYFEIPQLEFAALGGQKIPADDLAYAAGSIGYYMLGVAAADWTFDAGISPHTGTDAAAELLDVLAVNTWGLDAGEVLSATAFGLGDPLLRTVLLDTWTYDDPDFEDFRWLDRAWLALQWRRLVHVIAGGPGFAHVTAAGETNSDGGAYDAAVVNSTAGIASLPDLWGLAALDASPDELAAFTASYETSVAQEPAVAEALVNVLIVGSSDTEGNESAFSAPGSHVRSVGENVVGPCLAGEQCEGVSMYLDGSAGAAAQVAGLACYLWHLDGDLDVDELLARLQHAASASDRPGILDASIAALSVERAGSIVDLRRLLLDVSGPGDEPDGSFTEHDIEAFLEAFAAFEGAIEPDWSVYDLNGDGWTAGDGTARMDLDVNDLPGFGIVTRSVIGTPVEFDETAVSDLDVLCYYAHSDRYTGDPVLRDALLDCGGGDQEGPVVTILDEGVSQVTLDLIAGGSAEYLSHDESELVDAYGSFAADLDDAQTGDESTASGDTWHTAAATALDGGAVTVSYDGEASSSVAVDPADGNQIANASAGSFFEVYLEISGGSFAYSASGSLEAADDDGLGGTLYCEASFQLTPIGGGDMEPVSVGALSGGPVTAEIDVEGVLEPGIYAIGIRSTSFVRLRQPQDSRESLSGNAAASSVLCVLTPTTPDQGSARVVSGR